MATKRKKLTDELMLEALTEIAARLQKIEKLLRRDLGCNTYDHEIDFDYGPEWQKVRELFNLERLDWE
jgi:hypothetical protein